MDDSRSLWGGGPLASAPNVAVRALFGLRWCLGSVFRWDDERHDPPGASYVHRLTDTDRRTPGVSARESRRPVSVFDDMRDEALGEIRNAARSTCFVALALTHREPGYVLYAAVYVKAVSRFAGLRHDAHRPLPPIRCLPGSRPADSAGMGRRMHT